MSGSKNPQDVLQQIPSYPHSVVGPMQKKWEQQVGIILKVDPKDVFGSRTGAERRNLRSSQPVRVLSGQVGGLRNIKESHPSSGMKQPECALCWPHQLPVRDKK